MTGWLSPANFKLQFTTDGTTWTDSGWTVSPSYDYNSPSSSGGDIFIFSGSATSIRGARVVGQVHTGSAWSWYAIAKEIKVYAQQSSGGTTVASIILQAEDYNTGGEGVGYHDYDGGNNGGQYRSDDVDVISWTSGQYKIGWTRQGEWLKYNFTATTSGTYRFEAKVGTPDNNSKIHAEIDGVDVTGLLTINSSGGWDNWQTISKSGINISAGSHVLKVYFDQDSNEDVWVADMDLFSLVYEGGASSTSYTYDLNGNMLTDGLNIYEYNEANQLKRVKLASNSATLAEYMYDYNGLRMVKKNYLSGNLTNTITSWTESFETKVIEGGATETTVYYFVNGELVAKKNPDASRYYIHNDHLGSSSVITNSGGTLVEATTYDPYGRVLSGGTVSKFGYTGQEKDQESGLNYYDSRYYGSDVRRFVQPDSIIPNAYDPQQLNHYAYANNNPLKYTDPSGHYNLLSPLVGSIIGYFSGSNKEQKSNIPPPQSKPIQEIKGLSDVKGGVSGLSGGNTTSGNTTITTSQNSNSGKEISTTSQYSPTSLINTDTSMAIVYGILISNEVKDKADKKWGMSYPDGSIKNAWQHATWTDKIAQIAGFENAVVVGTLHEVQNYIQDTQFKRVGPQWHDYIMDEYNNIQGALGAKNGLTPDQLIQRDSLYFYR